MNLDVSFIRLMIHHDESFFLNLYFFKHAIKPKQYEKQTSKQTKQISDEICKYKNQQ